MATSNIVKIQQELALVMEKLKKSGKAYRDGVASAVYLEGLRIMRVSLRQVPVDFGNLRLSAYATLPRNAGEIAVRLGYGMNYGIYVHEDPKARHNPPTKYHFLTDPIGDAIPGMLERIAESAKRITESGRYVTTPLMNEKPQKTEVSVKVRATSKKSKRKSTKNITKRSRSQQRVTGKKQPTRKKRGK